MPNVAFKLSGSFAMTVADGHTHHCTQLFLFSCCFLDSVQPLERRRYILFGMKYKNRLCQFRPQDPTGRIPNPRGP